MSVSLSTELPPQDVYERVMYAHTTPPPRGTRASRRHSMDAHVRFAARPVTVRRRAATLACDGLVLQLLPPTAHNHPANLMHGRALLLLPLPLPLPPP